MPENYSEIRFIDVIGLIKRRSRVFIILPTLTLVVGVMINSVRDISYSVDIPYRASNIPPTESEKTYMARFEGMFFNPENFEEFDRGLKQSGIEYADINEFQNIENYRFQKSANKVIFNKESITIHISKPQSVSGIVKYINFIGGRLDNDLKDEVSRWNVELEKMLVTVISKDVEVLISSIMSNERFLHRHKNGDSALVLSVPYEPKRVGISDAALLLISLVLGTIISFIYSLLTTDLNE